MRERAFVAAELHTFFQQRGEDGGGEFFCNCSVDEDGLDGVAGAWPLAFGVNEDVAGHGEVCAGGDVGDADAVVVFDDGHARVADDGFDEALPAAGNDAVQELIHFTPVHLA